MLAGGHFGVSLCLLTPFTIRAEWLPKQSQSISSRAFAASFKTLGRGAWSEKSMHRSQNHFQRAWHKLCKAKKAKLKFEKAARHFNIQKPEKLNKAGEAFNIAHKGLQDMNIQLAICS